MSLYDQTWTPPSSTENKSTSYFMGYSKPQQESSIPLPHEDFTPYQQNFNQVDDFLTQTLTSLQELDIPVGHSEPSSSSSYPFNQNVQHQQNPHIRGHKKKPSGTAIFGFASHNKTLSIPGFQPRQPSDHQQGIAPNQLYAQSQYQPQQQQQQPTLYQKPQDIEAANQRIMQQNRQMYNEVPSMPPQYPIQNTSNAYPSQHNIVPQPQQQHLKKADDFIVTNKGPSSYKFPPEPPAAVPASASQQKTVSVPVEYLQKITNYIKSRENIDMSKFLDPSYDYSGLQNIQNARRSASPNAPVDISPVLKQMEVQHQQQPKTSESTEVNTPIYTPEEQKVSLSAPTTIHHHQQLHSQPSSSSQLNNNNAIGLGIRFEHNVKQDFESSDSEFADAPKTPSPILKSQATFSSEQKPKNEISWTPVIIGDKSLPMMKRKPQDKASTLPPGEIDQYVIGPREDKTYVCNFKGCGKLFTRRYNVRSHVQTHLSDRPFICDFHGCNKAFVRQHDLTRHKKIHEEFEFDCPCGKKFSRHDALYRHRIRMICSGGIKGTEEENALYSSEFSAPSSAVRNPPTITSNSITKSKKKPNHKPIRVENDKVAKRLEFDLLQRSNSPKNKQQTVATDGSENVFIEEQNQTNDADDDSTIKKNCTLDIHSSQTPLRDNSPPADESFLNDLNFGFESAPYEEFDRFVQ